MVVYQRATDYFRLHKGQSVSIALVRANSIRCYYLKESGGMVQVVHDSLRVFELGAITSAYTSYLLTTLIAEDKVKADDDVRKFLDGVYPHLQTNYAYVQLRHLAAHVSGLPRLPSDLKILPGYDSLNPYKHYPSANLPEVLKITVLENNPGEVMNYSAFGQAILGFVLERVSGQSYEALVRERICIPFGLRYTGTAVPIRKGINTYGDSVSTWQMNTFNPAGGIKSTLPDAARFLHQMMLRSTRASILMRSPVFSGRPAMTLGWYRKEKNGTTLFWHSGITYGYSGFMGYLDETNCGVVVLSDHAESVDALAISILRNVH
jgi:CubicO group peptidase (beta-lactamase class C family)